MRITSKTDFAKEKFETYERAVERTATGVSISGGTSPATLLKMTTTVVSSGQGIANYIFSKIEQDEPK